MISACLAGLHCRYDNSGQGIEAIIEIIKNQPSIIVCPEQIGGLTTPRPAAEIIGGNGNDVLDGKAKVINKEGEDVTEEYVKGAYEALKMAKAYDVKKAILKSRSPSCGCGIIYDGTFTSTRIEGDGVLAALLKKNGVEVITEEEL